MINFVFSILNFKAGIAALFSLTKHLIRDLRVYPSKCWQKSLEKVFQRTLEIAIASNTTNISYRK